MKTLAIALLMIATPAVAQNKAPEPEPSSHPDWNAARAFGEEILTRDLVDPESARIKWTKGFDWLPYKNGNVGMFGKTRWGWIACGTLNAKNRMGGYAGPETIVLLVLPNKDVKAGRSSIIDSHCSADGGRFGTVVPELKGASQSDN